MDRKDFLITIWQKGIRPLLQIAIIIFGIQFIYNVFSEDGSERFITLLIIGLGTLLILLYLFRQLWTSLSTNIYTRLPQTIKKCLRITRKFLDYIAPIILGMMIYHFWQEDWTTAAVVLSILCVQRIADIIREEKQASKSAIDFE